MRFKLFTLFMAAAFSSQTLSAANFGEDIKFLEQHTNVVVLSDSTGRSKVAVVPAWQGRVMTSTSAGDSGPSFGWINREFISSGKLQEHINVFGGEDRLWLGPEGGQFSIFFAKGAKFDLSNWYTPKAIDTMPWKVVTKSADRVMVGAEFALTNYSGTRFDVKIRRQVSLLNREAAWLQLATHLLADKNPKDTLEKIRKGGGVPSAPPDDLEIIGYQSDNELTNAGKEPWKKETGLLSIWILGMFNPAPETIIVVPIKSGPDAELGAKVTSDYFGAIPPDRLKVTDNAIYLSGDGNFRSKIGVNPRRSKGVVGSYDAKNKVLTIVQFTQGEEVDYVNSLWKIQDNPYGGDAANAYNDGVPAPGAKPLGPFFELESSSAAMELAPGKSRGHIHRTIHLRGSEQALDIASRAAFDIPLSDIEKALK